MKSTALTRHQMEEIIMAIVGRGIPYPSRFRAWLRSLPQSVLTDEYRSVQITL